MKNDYILFDKTDFGNIYKKMTADTGLVTALVQMQTDAGINEQKAYETADYLIHKVALFEDCMSCLRESTEDVLDDFLAYSQKLQGYDRKLLLHQLCFGLRLHQDASLIDRLKEGATIDELFRNYYAVYGENPAYSEDRLAIEIHRQASAFQISPEAMKAIVKNLEKSDDLVATSAVLSEDGLRFKCIVAMNLYLNNRDAMSIDDAVRTACTNLEVEAVADAVACGRMTADTAHKILKVVCIATVLMSLITLMGSFFAPQALGLITSNAEWIGLNAQAAIWEGMKNKKLADLAMSTGAKALESGLRGLSLNLFLGSGVVSLSENVIAEAVGKLASRFRFYYSKGTHSAAKDLEDLAYKFVQMNDDESEEQETAERAAGENLGAEEFQENSAVLF